MTYHPDPAAVLYPTTPEALAYTQDYYTNYMINPLLSYHFYEHSQNLWVITTWGVEYVDPLTYIGTYRCFFTFIKWRVLLWVDVTPPSEVWTIFMAWLHLRDSGTGVWTCDEDPNDPSRHDNYETYKPKHDELKDLMEGMGAKSQLKQWLGKSVNKII